jgi:hypothetical protein
MPAQSIVVCERGANVLLGLRRALGRQRVELAVVRTPADVEPRLRETAARLLVFEATPRDLDPLLDLTARLAAECPRLRSVAVLDHSVADYAGLFRELGAVHVEISARDLRPAVAIFNRLLAAEPAPAERELPLDQYCQRLLAELPWG